MDEELKQLAALALRNAYWRDLSSLANKYLEASEGLLGPCDQEEQMGDLTSIYGRDDEASGDEFLNIYTVHPDNTTFGYDTMLEALSDEGATEIYLRGDLVFKVKGGEWYFVAK